MSDTIQDYREMKKQLEKLQNDARKQMQARYTELLDEAARIQTEFKNDFNATPVLPASVKTFTINADAVTTKRGRKAAAATNGATTETPAEAPTISGKKLGGLKRSWASLTEKIAAAKAAGRPSKDLEDKLYEVEDELKLGGVNIDDLRQATTTETTPAEAEAVPAPEVIPPQQINTAGPLPF